eukprot:12827368-Alexandrium_andersonii.AAC.1
MAEVIAPVRGVALLAGLAGGAAAVALCAAAVAAMPLIAALGGRSLEPTGASARACPVAGAVSA